jgi:DnaJ-domain-containing protein 1
MGIGDLEALFAKSKSDAKVLRQLEQELQHRTVPRAVAMLQKVRKALKQATTEAHSPVIDQGVARAPVRPWAVPLPPVVSQPPVVPQPTVTVTQSPLPQISLEDACRILEVRPGDSWEEVEQSRRKLVLLSHPDRLVGLSAAQAEKARDAARRVNDACLVIAARRSGRQ